ncbi:hypothetical protein T10_12858 [Trichinella papuae]|uniref:EGF-like domain-containing protein n=1 Tax=Trichinella papuae TaxID=268474 RepID=A0A0V1MXC9_9BILA|nr:hypothetical protein T10_12858 [Trichinella papuae]
MEAVQQWPTFDTFHALMQHDFHSKLVDLACEANNLPDDTIGHQLVEFYLSTLMDVLNRLLEPLKEDQEARYLSVGCGFALGCALFECNFPGKIYIGTYNADAMQILQQWKDGGDQWPAWNLQPIITFLVEFFKKESCEAYYSIRQRASIEQIFLLDVNGSEKFVEENGRYDLISCFLSNQLLLNDDNLKQTLNNLINILKPSRSLVLCGTATNFDEINKLRSTVEQNGLEVGEWYDYYYPMQMKNIHGEMTPSESHFVCVVTIMFTTYWMLFALLFPTILSFCPHQLDLGYKGYYNAKRDECITYVKLDNQHLSGVNDGYEEARILCGQFYKGHIAHVRIGYVSKGDVFNNAKDWDTFYFDLPYEQFWEETNAVYLDGWKINGITLNQNATLRENEKCMATLTVYDDQLQEELETTQSCNEFFPVVGESGIFFDCNNIDLYNRTNPGCAVFAYGNLRSYTYLTLTPCKGRVWTGFFCSSKRMKNCQKKKLSSSTDEASKWCTCLPDFAGDFCEVELKSDPLPDCGTWGVGVDVNGTLVCQCFENAYGDRCENQYYDYEEYQDYKIEWNFICYATFPIIIVHAISLLLISCCQWRGFNSILKTYS